MSSLSARDPFRIGLALLLVLALIGVGIVLLSRASFGTRHYSAMLAQTAGLRAGEEVEVHGVQVGKVESTTIDGTAVKVGFTLDKDIALGDRSTAAVKVATLLGTHYLEVDPQGTGSVAEIPLARTSVPYNLQDVLNAGSAELGKLDAKALSKALSSVADTLGSSQDDVAPALAGVTALSQVISKRSTQTSALLTAARSVAQELSSDSGDIVGLMKQANLVIAELTSRRQAIRQLLAGATSLARSVSQVIAQTKADLGPALDDLDAVITTLNGQSKRISAVLAEVAPAARYVANATGNGPWLDLNLQSPAIPGDDTKCQLGDCK
jgi:phospholipid/cholesterol/gamma-HCH transport system substrate-binding protein